MYTEIASNKRKSIILIGVFLVLVIGLGWLISLYYGDQTILSIAVAIAVGQALASYYWADSIALGISGATEAPRKEPFVALHRAVENLAITAGLPKPRVYVIDDPAPNAFATGRDPKHAAIAVTTGLLQKLDKTELEGVIAHELSHIGNYDIRVMTIVVVLVGVISLVADFFLRSLWWGGSDRDRNGGGNQLMLIAVIVAAILAPIAATLIQLAVSRKREYLADATGALLTRYPDGLAKALEKIATTPHTVKHLSSSTNHLYIENPLSEQEEQQNWFATIFSTHPPVADRIKRLKAMIGKA
ncbi:M48 family metallopeptidase [Candidatus Berkelbacteria bacterium]|nr:M48 family metallopeptidase [Candidatus Berkelbacteria bacterium]